MVSIGKKKKNQTKTGSSVQKKKNKNKNTVMQADSFAGLASTLCGGQNWKWAHPYCVITPENYGVCNYSRHTGL